MNTMGSLASAVRQNPWTSAFDATLLGVAMMVSLLLALEYEIVVFWDQLTERQRRIRMEEIFLLSVLLAIGLVVFASRRMKEAQSDREREMRAAYEAEAAHALAMQDALTGLPNRRALEAAVERAIAQPPIEGRMHAFYLLDLNGFKRVNDEHGHAVGDALLQSVAKRFRAAARQEDLVARLGGDEFAVLLDGIREPLDAVRVAKRVQAMAEQPLSLDGQDVFATASIGVAVATDSHKSAEDIIRDADLAMYRAKHGGAGGYSVFDAALHEMAVRRLRLETDLRRAVERGEFLVWYQPIVSLTSEEIVGAEALVRWQHPERGMVPPIEFLEVAEEVGLIAQIDEYVLAQACRQAAAWQQDGSLSMSGSISVNLSARAFAQESLVQRVSGILRETGCPASALRLEITESVAIKDAARARMVLADLRRLGVRISLDDFGTGYSSLSYLQALPLDVLKIDRSFVTGIGTDAEKGEIVKLIVGLARGLGLEIVAEGVETGTQVEYLRGLGCQYGQGYFFAKPAAAGAWPEPRRRVARVARPSAASR